MQPGASIHAAGREKGAMNGQAVDGVFGVRTRGRGVSPRRKRKNHPPFFLFISPHGIEIPPSRLPSESEPEFGAEN